MGVDERREHGGAHAVAGRVTEEDDAGAVRLADDVEEVAGDEEARDRAVGDAVRTGVDPLGGREHGAKRAGALQLGLHGGLALHEFRAGGVSEGEAEDLGDVLAERGRVADRGFAGAGVEVEQRDDAPVDRDGRADGGVHFGLDEGRALDDHVVSAGGEDGGLPLHRQRDKRARRLEVGLGGFAPAVAPQFAGAEHLETLGVGP